MTGQDVSRETLGGPGAGLPQPPYGRFGNHVRHPFLGVAGREGYQSCVVCLSTLRDGDSHVPDHEIPEHAFASYVGEYGEDYGWKMCRHCGYQRVYMKHPAEQIIECGAKLYIDPENEGPPVTAICRVDVERTSKHIHHASLKTLTVDGGPTYRSVSVSWDWPREASV